MSQSVLTIHREMEKKAYAESPLGKVERQITKIYDDLVLNKKALPEDIAKKIYDIRDANEKSQKEYIDMTLKRDKQAVSDMLFDSMSKELSILNDYLNNQSTTKTT